MISCATPPSLPSLAPSFRSPVLAKLACDLAAIQAIRNVSLVAVTQGATPTLLTHPPPFLALDKKCHVDFLPATAAFSASSLLPSFYAASH